MSSFLHELFDPEGEFNRAEVIWKGEWSGLSLCLILLLAAITVWLSWKNLSPLNTKRRWGLVSLRAFSVALCLFLFFQPAVRLEDVTRLRNHLPVLVDVSQSMSLPGEEAGASRFQAAISLLEASSSRLERWRKEHHLHFFQFAERIEPLPGGLESLNSITPQGGGTALLGAVEGVAARYRPEELAAVIILSDGDDRSGALPEAAREAPAKLGALGAQLGAPIHTFFTGPETPPVDVSIESVRHDDFAFVRNPIKIETAIQLQGLTAARLPPLQVTFSKEGVVLGQRLLIPQSDEGRYLFEFEFTPEQTGEAIYEISVEAAPGETILNNNKRLFPIRIIRDKIRALQVVGRPSWDERFLRKLLKRNPNIELISFFILRTNASVDATPSDELSLIPFPTQELFEEKLHTFDLLIFQNFTFRGYRMRQFLPLIQRYVERGGGFMMLGGDQSFSLGGYQGTPIEDLLPFELPVGGSLHEGNFRPTLESRHALHPILNLSLIREENQRLWGALPSIPHLNQVGALRPGAQLLLSARQEGGAPHPLAATLSVGEGRVFAFASDGAWRWAFSGDPAAAQGRHYHRFWGNTIRWLIRDPALNPLKVSSSKDKLTLGEALTLSVQLRGSNYQPLPESLVQLTVSPLQQTGERVAEEVKVWQLKTDEEGQVLQTFTPPKSGAWRVRARADVDGSTQRAEDLFIVSVNPRELQHTGARPRPLEWLSSSSGGEARRLEEGLADLNRQTPQVMRVNRRRDQPLWSSGWLFLFLTTALSVGWWLRRRWGLA